MVASPGRSAREREWAARCCSTWSVGLVGAGVGGRAGRWCGRRRRRRDFLFSDIPVRGDDGARAVGAIDDDDVGFGERRRWWRRRVAQRGSATYGVIDSDRQILPNSAALTVGRLASLS